MGEGLLCGYALLRIVLEEGVEQVEALCRQVWADCIERDRGERGEVGLVVGHF